MDRLALLRTDTDQDSQALETDVMRFVAIIGMVFWIIFALVKSIPVMDTRTDQDAGIVAEPARPSLQHETVSEVSESSSRVQADSQAIIPEKKEEKTRQKSAPASAVSGINLQFRSRDDLLQLLEAGRVEIYCRARARGFELIFKGGLHAGNVVFKGTDAVPPVLWEIKSGRDYTWFSKRLAETCPAVRTFPVKQVMVAFVDRELEKRVDTEFSRLSQEGKGGVLSVTGLGDMVFEQGGERQQ